MKSLDKEDEMENELSALCKLSHPNIIPIYQVLYTDQRYYIVSENMKDGDLKDLIDERKKNGDLLKENDVLIIV